ncbi:hypothetical protein RRF57_013035 [Xylaria bambusicola]|uniref:Uncharacterized protein n=1 Tax=Xylaria bambusicola TaxID=326684 RepID=A0AAN7V0C6_9PEZI
MHPLNNATADPVFLGISKAREYNERTLALVVVGILSLYLTSVIKPSFSSVKAPFVGYRSWLEPGWLVRLRFIRGSRPIIREGYSKVFN